MRARQSYLASSQENSPMEVYVDSFDAPFAINDPYAAEDGC